MERTAKESASRDRHGGSVVTRSPFSISYAQCCLHTCLRNRHKKWITGFSIIFVAANLNTDSFILRAYLKRRVSRRRVLKKVSRMKLMKIVVSKNSLILKITKDV